MQSPVKTKLRAILAGVLALAALPALAEHPEKPITLIVPFAAGGSTETMARVFSEDLGEEPGQRVIVKTRPGAGGAIAATELANSPNDGYTIMFSTSGALLWAPLTRDVSYSVDSFTAVAQITTYQQAIAVKADAPYETFEDLLESAKGDDLNFADQGAITKAYIDYIASQEGVAWTGIPTKGGGEAMPFLLGGKVDFTSSGGVHSRYCDEMRVLLGLIDTPLMGSPDAPTIKDRYGIAMPGHGLNTGPAGLPDDVVSTLEAAISVAVEDEAFVELLTENLKFPVTYLGSEEVSASLLETNEGLKTVLANIGQ